MNDTVKKLIIGACIIVVAFPALMAIIPKAKTTDTFVNAFKKRWTVEEVTQVRPPGLQAVEHVSMRINGALVDLYRYDDEGKIAKQYEYQKPGAGDGIAQSMGIAAALGASTKPPPAFVAGRNGKFMIVTSGLEKPQLQEIVRAFESM